MLRSARVAPPGVIFHVLNRGNDRRRIFDDDDDYAAFERVLVDALAAEPVRLLAYCLMPNHWHLILQPTADGQLGRFMQRGKEKGSEVGRKFNAPFHSLFQPATRASVGSDARFDRRLLHPAAVRPAVVAGPPERLLTRS